MNSEYEYTIPTNDKFVKKNIVGVTLEEKDNQGLVQVEVDELQGWQFRIWDDTLEYFMSNPDKVTEKEFNIRVADNGQLKLILDGHHRIEALNRLGIETVKVELISVESINPVKK